MRDGAGGEQPCRARGKLRQQEPPLVGDRVIFSTGVVEEILARTNRLIRPPVANVDRLVLVASLKEPEPDWATLNRQLVAAEQEGVACLLCFNKTDLAGPDEIESFLSRMNAFPYRFILTSARLGKGFEQLRSEMKAGCSVLAGQSGVGKSTLLNGLQPELRLQTGELSDRLKRGRHTTRTVEMVALGQGWVVDTPGFSRFDQKQLVPRQLAEFFPEMQPYFSHCLFRNCYHLEEPGCAVRSAAEADKEEINRMRYHYYRLFLQEALLSKKAGPQGLE